jgi:hypothetical protein
VAFALRHPVPFLVVLTALLVTSGIFVFARPQYEPRYASEMIDFSKRRYYSPGTVRRAFAAEGVRLEVASRFSGMLTLSDAPRPLTADTLQIVIAPRNGSGSWGPKLEPYDERFGNVLVTYGGTDAKLLLRVEAAVAALR